MDNQPIQPTPIPSPNHSSKTMLLILGTIALMLVSALGGYYLGANKQSQTPQLPTQPYRSLPTPTTTPTPTSDETANWKTFTGTTKDPVIKHSFQYPPDLVVSQVPGLFSNGVTNKTDYVYLNNQQTSEMEMSTDFTPGTFQAFASILNLDNKDPIEEALSKENKILGGKDAIRIFMDDRNDPKVKLVEYKVYDLNIKGIDKKWGLSFSCYFVPKEGIDLEKQCDKITSTFKFTP